MKRTKQDLIDILSEHGPLSGPELEAYLHGSTSQPTLSRYLATEDFTSVSVSPKLYWLRKGRKPQTVEMLLRHTMWTAIRMVNAYMHYKRDHTQAETETFFHERFIHYLSTANQALIDIQDNIES